MIQKTTHKVFGGFYGRNGAVPWVKVAEVDPHRKFLRISGDAGFELIFEEMGRDCVTHQYSSNRVGVVGGGLILNPLDAIEMKGVVHLGEVWARVNGEGMLEFPNLTVLEITQIESGANGQAGHQPCVKCGGKK